MVAEPADLAVTVPSEATVATDVLLEDQVTSLFVALEGLTVAVNWEVSPSVMVIEDEFREIPVTGTSFAFTVTWQLAVLPPSVDQTTTVVVPGDIALIVPDGLTLTTELLLEAQVTLLSVALLGETVA